MRKKRILGLALASVTALGLLSGCGGGGGSGLLSGVQAGDGGKVLNIYVWNEEFQNTFGDYFNGKISLDKAKANFEMSITERYPWLVGGGVEWP